MWVGGRLRFSTDKWKNTDNKWVLLTIKEVTDRNFNIVYWSVSEIMQVIYIVNALAIKIINYEVEKLLEKGAVEPVPFVSTMHCFSTQKYR